MSDQRAERGDGASDKEQNDYAHGAIDEALIIMGPVNIGLALRTHIEG
jgi:hypothetical protein